MNPVTKYFTAERAYCALGMGIGLVAILISIYFLVRVKQPFYTGMSYPLIIIGLFFLVICTGVYLRSPKDITRVNAAVATNVSEIKNSELPRMENVMKNFRVIMVVEMILILVSACLLIFPSLSASWRGAMTGLLFLSLLLFAFDWLANKRGSEYHQYLESLTK